MTAVLTTAGAVVLAADARWTVIAGEFQEVTRGWGPRSIGCIVTDPPYSRHVHKSVRSAGRNTAPDVVDFECRTRRVVDLGFEHLDPKTRRDFARLAAHVTGRWVLAFSDEQSTTWLRIALESAGLIYRRTAAWVREGGAPQFTGTEPASGIEPILCCHQPGRRHWHGGGKAGLYAHPIVANRKGQQGSRVHPAQKPLDLMVDLVRDFTDPDEIVLDPFCGSGTTGVACLMIGRRFVGIERDVKHAETARRRLSEVSDVELPGSRATRARQIILTR